jgi:hypothetical protein
MMEVTMKLAKSTLRLRNGERMLLRFNLRRRIVTSEHVYQCGKDGSLAVFEDLCKEEAVKVDTTKAKEREVDARKSKEDTPKAVLIEADVKDESICVLVETCKEEAVKVDTTKAKENEADARKSNEDTPRAAIIETAGKMEIEFDTRDVLMSLKENKATRSESKVIDSPLVDTFSKHLENAVRGSGAASSGERSSLSWGKERDLFTPTEGGRTGSSNDSKSSYFGITNPKSVASPKSEKSNNSYHPSAADTATSVEKRIFNMSTQLVDELFDEPEPIVQKRPFPKSPTSSNTFKIPPPRDVDDRGLAYVDPEEANAKRKLFENVGSSLKRVKTGDEGKRFMISGVSAKSRGVLCAAIKKLGGVVLEGGGWDQSCTHLICAKPSKTGLSSY